MDREIDWSIRRSKIVKRAAVSTVLLFALGAGLIWGPARIRPSVRRSEIRTARVDRGAIEAGISASGTVVPEFEAVLSSPIDARVIRILKRTGDPLSSGDPIIELDVSSSQLALERINQNLALKQNQQARTRLELEQTLNSLQSQMEIKRLELETHSAQVSQTQRLFQDGLASMAMQGGGKLTIRTGIRNDRKYLSIEDTGCGMSAEVQANLFVPFFSTKANGQGIGLTLVQEILSHHRFDFALESKPGGPTLFNIFFTF